MSQTFDYIIIGAGSAGCVLANRLSKNPNNQVLLLEAGPKDRSPNIKMPMGFALLMHDKKYNWCYKTEAEPFMQQRQIEWPKGKTLGGSSAINGMVYIRGHADDFNHWQALGCDGWSYQDVLPYFKRAEHNIHGESTYHGATGPLWVDDVINRFPLADKFLQAGIEVGLPENSDFNGQQQAGIGRYQVNIKNGQRASAADTYLKPVLKRPNLTVLTGALCQKIIFADKKAVAIEVKIKKSVQRFSANKEIILSAGTIESPKLLELSGIGAKEVLEKHAITPVHYLPGVGENLQDHLTVNVIHDFKGINTFTDETRALKLIKHLYLYFVKHQGLLTYPAAEVGAFLSTDPTRARPNLQLHYAPAAGEFSENGNMKSVPGTTATICQVNPESRGSVHIKSADSQQPPAICANYLATDYDRKTMIGAIREVRKIFAADLLKPWDNGELAPGLDIQSDEQILGYIQKNAGSIYHCVGSCKMGNDEMAVVDSQLKVHGIDNLRVVDASVMPTITAGNTHAATVMIAEKAADMILQK